MYINGQLRQLPGQVVYYTKETEQRMQLQQLSSMKTTLRMTSPSATSLEVRMKVWQNLQCQNQNISRQGTLWALQEEVNAQERDRMQAV